MTALDEVAQTINAMIKGVLYMIVAEFFPTTEDKLVTPVGRFIGACIIGHIDRIAYVAAHNARITKGGMFQVVKGVNLHWKLVDIPKAARPITMWLEVSEDGVSQETIDKLTHILEYNNVLMEEP